MKFRFAPSPTGTLHIGSARTAVFNYLMAKHLGAKIILRIEDTDAKRSTKEFEDNILDNLKWLGMEFDETWRQSERKKRYEQVARKLIKDGLAYEEEGCVKLRLFADTIGYTDLFRGLINRQLEHDNIVIIKSDGMATYQFAVVVDDSDMEITHVIRGQDHIPNTFKQIAIYDALGLKPPEFGHISLILGSDKSKLSKRNGATSVDEFKDMGISSEALFNYLALLGWSHPEGKEILTKEELIESYVMDKVKKSNTMFDEAKLKWINKKWKLKI